jgi:RNA polymerase sigma-70 factor, ECF subfamily
MGAIMAGLAMPDAFLRSGGFLSAMADPIARLVPSIGPPGSSEDVQLVQALRARRPDAAGILWDRYSRLVRRVVQRAFGPSSSDVDDLVQDVFMRVFNHVDTLREPEALRGFILTVTSSIIASEMRRRKVRRFLGLTRGGDLPDVPGLVRDDDSRELLTRVYAVLDRAPTEERMAFVLHNLEGLELVDVARSLEISVATVKRRITRVQDRLSRAVRSDPEFARGLGLLEGNS